MSTTTEKAEYLSETKNAIANALIEQGVSVEGDAPFRSYAGKVLGIHGRLTTELAGRAIEADHAANADSAETLSKVLSPELGGTGKTSLRDIIPVLQLSTEGHEHVSSDVTDLQQFFDNQPVVRVVTGTHIGTGDNKLSVTLGFKPRILMISYKYRSGYGRPNDNADSLVSTRLHTRSDLILYLGHDDNVFYRKTLLGEYDDDNSRQYMSISEFDAHDTGFIATMTCILSGSLGVYPYDENANPVASYGSSVFANEAKIDSDLGTRYYYTAIG